MIEITLLKTTHEGLNEAKKLMPYIKASDVYGPENAESTEATCQNEERIWEDILARIKTRSELKREIASSLEGMTPEVADYSYVQREYLFLNKVPIWQTERFNVQEVQALKQLYKESRDLFQDAILRLSEGNIDGFFKANKRSRELDLDATKRRDIEIARNIDRAEEAIRSRYPRLSSIPTIRYVMNLGAFHTPEKYAKSKITIHNIQSNTDSFADRINYQYYHATTNEDLKYPMLAYAMLLMAQRGHVKTDGPISKLSYDNLMDLAKRSFPLKK